MIAERFKCEKCGKNRKPKRSLHYWNIMHFTMKKKPNTEKTEKYNLRVCNACDNKIKKFFMPIIKNHKKVIQKLAKEM